MKRIAYYEGSIQNFLTANEDAILGVLSMQHGFALEHEQKYAWQSQIQLLQHILSPSLPGQIYFEFSIPRMGKRADVVLLTGGVVFVIEFKVGSQNFDRYALEQVHDYALDLKNFHRGSHNLPIVPILVPTAAAVQQMPAIEWAADQVATPLCLSASLIPQAIEIAASQCSILPVESTAWSNSGYQPTPTIVEAALALYRQHDVKEITRSEAGADNLGLTARRVEQIIEHAKANSRKAICFITGVPGAGKTLAGLNIATSRAEGHSDEHAVFLSGNGPLVDVLREALARDKAEREQIPRTRAYREISTFVQNIHHFRDEALESTSPPIEKVVIFDEAQRAWNREMASKFMQQKRGYVSFDMSEPAFLLQVMNRHSDWCVVICLIGGGQEINTGEAGLGEWISVVTNNYRHWDLHVSSRLDDSDYIWDKELAKELTKASAFLDEDLHLGVSVRSFRAETLSEFVGHMVDNRPDQARQTYQAIEQKYPIFLTRNLSEARLWLQTKARGSERYGLTASSGANRLRPDGIWIKPKVDAPVWFLNDKLDVRSSYYLEEAATEFDIQGLELDWTCVAWDADFRREDCEWQYFSFRGTKWQHVNTPDRQLYLKNTYRVLLTRARQGMVIFIPPGETSDPTRTPEVYDRISEYLHLCGIPSLPSVFA
ncbi:MAG: DUF2075 domain-containing protein [Betaproteobacteria bacterium]|nr:DUF2075 domain-containing protein [Betaproteobacteria bacterium]NBT05617.1 DUF2075 domain-containing protein [Betaproteobacteria bacterium]NBT82552.1 DUF2075 domain-containing protein [Betaproteobacteria bacterium]NCY08138.1 DUF2075 domain-containing protein [Betaproteobacteria bacterium]NDE54265.1 DUF2075 domain-containing protein [Actinomycetota bacterium]